MKYDRVAVLLPAYKPDERLIKLVDDLRAAGFERLFVVDDGGQEPFRHIFDAIADRTCVLVHEVNRGKGAGLKTGLKEIRKTDCVGVVTADCDGQHTPQDVAKIADALLENPDALVLGSRDKKQMPPRSKFGNTLTCGVFAFLTGLKIGDTQTGLRGIPATAMEAFSTLDGDRYEYEINMLMYAAEQKMTVREVEIETIYIDNNSASHFNGLKDGLKIYRLMFRKAGKFVLSSIAAWVIDYAAYSVLVALSMGLVPAQIIARVISSLGNYWMNSKLVFEKKPSLRSLAKYYLLAACILALSCGGLELLDLLHVNAYLAKLLVDCLLYLLSYTVQRSHVFNEK